VDSFTIFCSAMSKDLSYRALLKEIFFKRKVSQRKFLRPVSLHFSEPKPTAS
jgi:hypothetical protein